MGFERNSIAKDPNIDLNATCIGVFKCKEYLQQSTDSKTARQAAVKCFKIAFYDNVNRARGHKHAY